VVASMLGSTAPGGTGWVRGAFSGVRTASTPSTASAARASTVASARGTVASTGTACTRPSGRWSAEYAASPTVLDGPSLRGYGLPTDVSPARVAGGSTKVSVTAGALPSARTARSR
jgi:hypothetical protein